MKFLFVILVLIFAAVFTTFLYHNTQQADISYYRAHRLFLESQYNKAIPLYKKSLEKNSRHPDALRELADCYKWTGKYKEAIEAFQKILSLTPQDYKIKKSLAEVYSWNKQYDQAVSLYSEVINTQGGDIDTQRHLAQAYLWDGQHNKAEILLKTILKIDPDDSETKLLLAKALHYSGQAKEASEVYEQLLDGGQEDIEASLGETYLIGKDYDRAIKQYREILKKDPQNIEAMVAIADILSWQRKYDEALKLYDELLNEKEDVELRLQKARILGWARRYSEALKEYQNILDLGYNELVELEMQAKSTYWDNRVKRAISNYKKLIAKNPQNLEAMFDLSQIYSYQSMWQEAIDIYDDILKLSPEHFRAKEGKSKAMLIAKGISLDSQYEYFEADSSSRQSDIKKHVFLNRLRLPLDYKTVLGIDYGFAERKFSDFDDLSDNRSRIMFSYNNQQHFRLDGFYNFISYNRGIDSLHEFGAGADWRVFDFGNLRISSQRKAIENNSTVMRNNYYCDNYKTRLDIDIDKRLKAGADYLYAYYSDSNSQHEPAGDVKYYFSLEPKAFYLKYRYFFRDFDEKMTEYFSPQDFSTHAIALHWRHFLNKEEIFFGADDIYYDLGYDVSVDSQDIASHKFSGAFVRDINKRFQLKTEAQYVYSSAGVYEDKRILASLRYRF